MARSRRSAKQAGTAFETACAGYLSEQLHRKITRMPKSGARDKGDLYGIECHGEPMVGECKSPGKDSSWSIAEWWRETEDEILNYGARYGMLIVKRYGKSISDSICIVDDAMWESLGGHKYHQPVAHKAIANKKWGEAIDKNGVCAIKRHGVEGNWIVSSLEIFSALLYAERLVDAVYLSKEQAHTLAQGEGLTVTTESGKELVIKVGVPPEIDLSLDIEYENPVSLSDFPPEQPLIEL